VLLTATLGLFLLSLTSCHVFMLGNVIFQECLSSISAFVVELGWGCLWEHVQHEPPTPCYCLGWGVWPCVLWFSCWRERIRL